LPPSSLRPRLRQGSVGRVTAKCDEVGHLLRVDPVTLPHLGRADPGHLAGAHRMQDRGHLRRELEGIPVPAGDERGPASPLFMRDGSCEEIVRLISGGLGICETACRDEVRQILQLVNQLVVELPPTLVSREGGVPIRRAIQGVPADKDGSGQLCLIETQEEVRETDNGAPSPPAPPTYGFRQPVIGAVGERIPVDDQQRLDHARLHVPQKVWVTR
jgi:hypothetical protein